MGVDLLTKFVDENRRTLLAYLEWHPRPDGDAEKPRVVLDGLGVLYFVFNRVSDWRFSGGWVLVRRELAAIVDFLRSVAIISAVVMDGATSSAKLEESRERFARKATDTEFVMRMLTEGEDQDQEAYRAVRHSAARMLPLGDRDIFTKMLVDLGVRVVLAEGEADRILAAEALRADAFIIGRDSDFYILPSKGYIALDTINFPSAVQEDGDACHLSEGEPEGAPASPSQGSQQASESQPSIEAYTSSLFASVFTRSALAGLLGMSDALFPLWACLLGNDYVSRDTFSDFRTQAKRGDKGSKKAFAEFYATAAVFAGIDTLPKALAHLRQQGMPKDRMDLLEHGTRQYSLEGGHPWEWRCSQDDYELLTARALHGLLGIAAANLLATHTYWCWPLIEPLGAPQSLWGRTATLRAHICAIVLPADPRGGEPAARHPAYEYHKKKGGCARSQIADPPTPPDRAELLLPKLRAGNLAPAPAQALLTRLGLPENVVAQLAPLPLQSHLPLLALLYLCQSTPRILSDATQKALIRFVLFCSGPGPLADLQRLSQEHPPHLSAENCGLVSAWLSVLHVVSLLNQTLLLPFAQPDTAVLMDGFLLHTVLCSPKARLPVPDLVVRARELDDYCHVLLIAQMFEDGSGSPAEGAGQSADKSRTKTKTKTKTRRSAEKRASEKQASGPHGPSKGSGSSSGPGQQQSSVATAGKKKSKARGGLAQEALSNPFSALQGEM